MYDDYYEQASRIIASINPTLKRIVNREPSAIEMVAYKLMLADHMWDEKHPSGAKQTTYRYRAGLNEIFNIIKEQKKNYRFKSINLEKICKKEDIDFDLPTFIEKDAREIFHLKFVHNMNLKEISEYQGVAYNIIKKIYYRTLKQLRVHFIKT